MRLGILGGGRAAWAFGSTWQRMKWPLAGVWLRAHSSSRLPELLDTPRVGLAELANDSDLLLLAVTDGALDEVAARIPRTDAIIFHASGALPAVRGGFSLHPLRALPPVGQPSDLAGALLVFEGAHRETAGLIATAAGARLAELDPKKKPLYHAAAVFGANYAAAVADIAARLMAEAGVEHAREDVYRLAVSALENWRDHPGSGRFTGPAARGDREVQRRNLDALAHHPQLTEIYELLAAEIASSILATDD